MCPSPPHAPYYAPLFAAQVWPHIAATEAEEAVFALWTRSLNTRNYK